MLIAVASSAPDAGGIVPDLFARSPYLLVMETDTGALIRVLDRKETTDDAQLARAVVRLQCEGILCGPIPEAPFLILADEGCVTRYNAAGLSVPEALERFARRDLELIRDHLGGQGCVSGGGGESGGVCREHA